MTRRAGLVLGLLLGLTGPRPADAHDIPNERVDRAVQVVLGPGELRVDYEVSLAELTLAQDLRRLVGSVPGSDREALYRRYGSETAPLNARGFLVSVDGRAVELKPEGFDLSVEEHPRFLFHFQAAVPRSGFLSLRDTNYVDSEGTSRLALRSEDGVALSGYEGPERVEDVEARPVWMLSDAEERATRAVQVSYSLVSAPVQDPGGRGSRRAASPGGRGSRQASSPAGRGSRRASFQAKTSSPETSPSRPPEAVPPKPSSNSLSRLLDRGAAGSVMGLWLLALGLGMAHAVQPGHGKTLVAAATLGSHGGWPRGVALALVTTLAHFGSVLLVAAALWATNSTRYEALNQSLARVAGFVIAAIGLWRLGRHLGGFGEHEHREEGKLGGSSLVGLGLAGGMVPCWDAVLLVVLADLAGRLMLGLLLLSAFSLGMAAVLVAVGLMAGRFRDLLDRKDREGRWERGLGLLSGLALSAVGLYLFVS